MNRQEARAAGLKRFRSGRLCPRGHNGERFTSNGCCCSCLAENVNDWRKANPEKRKAAWDRQNLTRRINGTYRRPREQEVEQARKWREANRERFREISRRSKRKRPDAIYEENAWRRAAKIQATPDWVDRKEIRAIYADRRRVSAETGEVHHVDHIVPLVHPLVCGLHVPWNLRVIPAAENLRKNNFFDIG